MIFLYTIERVICILGILAFSLVDIYRIVSFNLSLPFIFSKVKPQNILPYEFLSWCHALSSLKYMNISLRLCQNSGGHRLAGRVHYTTHTHTHTFWFICPIWWKWGCYTKQRHMLHISVSFPLPTLQYWDVWPNDTILSMLGLYCVIPQSFWT